MTDGTAPWRSSSTSCSGSLAGGLEVLSDGGALGLQAVPQVVQPALHFGVDERRRRVVVDQLDQGVDRTVAQRHARLDPLHRADPLSKVVAQLLHGVELRRFARPTRR